MLIPPLLQVRGKTPRLARLISAVGAIFDCRSISDLANSRPGEPKRLCLQAASHCRDALCVWRELASTPALAEHRPQSDESAAAEAQECRLRMSETLVLLGRSLCNYGLDGDGEDMSAVAAFEEAEAALREAFELRSALAAPFAAVPGDGSVLAGDQRAALCNTLLAEAHMALGYWFYCKAGALVNLFHCRC